MPTRKAHPHFRHLPGFTGTGGGTGGSLHRKLCEQPELLEHREIPNCRWSSNMRRRMKFWLKGGITVCVVT